MNGVKSGKRDKVKNVVMNGVVAGKVGKLENCKSDEGMLESKGGEIVQINHKRLRETPSRKDTQFWRMWKKNKNKDVICFHHITRQEDCCGMPVRKARELELKYLRDLGVYEKG